MKTKHNLHDVMLTAVNHSLLWEWAQETIDWPSSLELDCEKPHRYKSLGRFIAKICDFGTLDLELCTRTADVDEIRNRAKDNYSSGMHTDAYNLAMLADYIEQQP